MTDGIPWCEKERCQRRLIRYWNHRSISKYSIGLLSTFIQENSYSNEGQMQSSGLGVDSFGGLCKSNHDIQPPYYKCIPSTLGTKKGQLDNVPPNQDNIPLLTTQILCPSGSDKCEIYKDTEQQRARPQVERHYRESSQQNPRVSRIPE